METRKLSPIIDKISFSDDICSLISKYLYEIVFAPVMEALDPKVKLVYNGKYNAIMTAVNTDKIAYQNGYFVGKFNASISKDLRNLGATWDKTRKAFKLSLSGIPMELKQAISASTVRVKETQVRIQKILDKVQLDVRGKKAPTINYGNTIHSIVGDLDKQFKKTTARDIEIPMDMELVKKSNLIQEYEQSTNKYIDEWTDKAVIRLRKKVEQNVQGGFRADTLTKHIEAEFGVSKRKAKMIARQETSVLVSKYREVRYKDAGIAKYEWSTSGDQRVRDDHKKLDGRIFTWDSPPIVDSATGQRAHPGESYNCRCVAVPIIVEM